MPLQSLSLPSQISGPGVPAPTHTRVPFTQPIAPGRHSPTPPGVPPQGLPPSVVSLSTLPSQSLSRPSQISTPPLVMLQANSQPSAGSLFLSLNPGLQPPIL